MAHADLLSNADRDSLNVRTDSGTCWDSRSGADHHVTCRLAQYADRDSLNVRTDTRLVVLAT